MTEVLSQQEIDALLSAISTSEGEEVDGGKIVDQQRQVKIYDFKRPDKFSKDQIRTLQMMHETFARLTTTSLSAQLRTLVHVHLVSVDQLTYEEFVRSIPSPTTLGVINMDPLKGSSVLEIDPSITFTIIDRLFGGTGDAAKINRELTDIELSVIEGIIVRMLANLRESWSNVIDLRPRLGTIETNPQFAQIVPPNDMVVLITLETKVGEVEGMTNFCIPYITIEPIISKLSAQYWYSSIRKGATRENFNVLRKGLSGMMVDVVAELGSVEVTMKDIIDLQEGDVIKFPKNKISDALVLKISNSDKFYCWPGVVGSKLAVQLDSPIQNMEGVDIFDKLKTESEDSR